MTLEKALHILARTHTRDDDLTGFVVEWAPSPSIMWEHSQAEYIEAWKTVRAHIHYQTEPGCPHCGAGNVARCRLPTCLWTN